MNTHTHLKSIMNRWQGQNVVFKVEGYKIIVKESGGNSHPHPINNYSTHRRNTYRRTSKDAFRSNNAQQNSQNNVYLFQVNSKSPRQKSFAEMNEQYADSRNYEHSLHRSRTASNASSRIGNKENIRNFKYDFSFPVKKSPPLQSPLEKIPEHDEISSVMKSIQSIRLPSHSRPTPQYEKASLRFQLMKEEILAKLNQQNFQYELNDIISEIKEAAHSIIRRHAYEQQQPQPEVKLKKNLFSFNERSLQQNESPSENAYIADKSHLGLQNEDESKYIELNQCKDDTSSISSILSLLAQKKEESQEQKKTANIFIGDGLQLKCDENVKREDNLNIKQNSKDNANSVRSANIIPVSMSNEQNLMRNVLKPKMIGQQKPAVQNKDRKAEYETQAAKVISLPAFRRKQEVVKHLVANHIVERESSSIEF